MQLYLRSTPYLAALLALIAACGDDNSDDEALATSDLAITAQPDPSCTYVKASPPYGDHEYWFCTAPKPADQAAASGAAVGMQLARIDTQLENGWVRDNFVGATGSAGFAWLGGADAAGNGQWRWNIGNDVFWPAGTAYTNWKTGEPSG